MRTLLRAAMVAVVVAAGASPGQAAVYNVNTTTDLPDVLPGDGICATGVATCSLRAAVMTANANPGLDTINIPASVLSYDLTYLGALEDAALTGDLDLADDVDIVGAGAKTVVIDGQGSDRLFHVTAAVTVSISGVTLTNGYGVGAGGAIYLNAAGASLSLDAVRVVGNVTNGAGGGNTAGGALSMTSGSHLGISNSSIDSNNAIATANATGGGLALNGPGVIVLTNVTVSGNSVSAPSAIGSGISCGSSHPSLNNVTVSSNTGAAGVSKNTSGGVSPTVRNSIIAGNSPTDCAASTVPIVSLGYTLFGSLSGCAVTPGPGDVVNPAPGLAALADNGGDTPTRALVAGSPAIAAGSPDTPGSMTATSCEALDQRGGLRAVPIGTRCDMGAYETGCGNLLADPSEICDGGSCCTAACGFVANLTPCPDDGNECTNDRCNGASAACQHPAKLDGTTCTDEGEFCTNDQCIAGACSHPAKVNGTACPDEPNECTTDTCQTGLCDHAPVTVGTACNDDNACTTGDTCQAGGTCVPGAGCAPCTVCGGPLTGCEVGTTPTCATPPDKKSAFSVKTGASPADTKFKWKWTKGPNVTPIDLGDPVGGTSGYTLCVFDNDGSSLAFQTDVAPGDSCGTMACWKPTKAGFKFFDKSTAQDGVRGVQVFAGALGKAKLIVSGQGANIPATNLPYTTKVVVELHRTDAPVCWSGEYSTHVLASSNAFFKAVSDP